MAPKSNPKASRYSTIRFKEFGCFWPIHDKLWRQQEGNNQTLGSGSSDFVARSRILWPLMVLHNLPITRWLLASQARVSQSFPFLRNHLSLCPAWLVCPVTRVLGIITRAQDNGQGHAWHRMWRDKSTLGTNGDQRGWEQWQPVVSPHQG